MEIVWRDAAGHGLLHARAYIAEHNLAAAERVFEAILTAVRHLAEFPQQGRPGRVAGTRELVVANTPYIVVYAVIGSRVEILSVHHAARRWPDRF
jgi:toxin ParE1/3/4